MAATHRIFIPFGEFNPDAGHFLSNGLVSAHGCIPSGDKFLPLPPMLIRSDSLASTTGEQHRCHVNVNPPSGSPKIYVVSGSKVYVVDTGAGPPWTSAEVATTGVTIGVDSDSGDMFGFGQHEIITQGHTNHIAYRSFGAGNFLPLIQTVPDPADPTLTIVASDATRPKAKFGSPIGDRLLIGNIAGAAPLELSTPDPNPDMLWWSKSRDASVFSTEAASPDARSGYTFLYDDHGPIMGLSGGKEYALIFKRRAIYRMDFTGAFGNTFRCIPQSYGTISHLSLARLGNDVYFWSDAGPCVYRNDQVFQLSAARITAFLSGNTLTKINHSVGPFKGAAVDQANQTVSWLFDYIPADGGTIRTMLLVYSVMNDAFSVAFDITNAPTARWYQESTPTDVIPANAAILFDGLPQTAPSTSFMGNLILAEVFPAPDEIVITTFGADNADSNARWWDQDTIFKTGFYALGGQMSALIKKVRPIIRATSYAATPEISVRVWTKTKPWDDPNDSTGYNTAQDKRGYISLLEGKGAQFQQIELKLSRRADGPVYASDVIEIEGVEIEYEEKPPL
jgi:hypothetical protein